MSKNIIYELLGIGVGPFNLSLAALLKDKMEEQILFLEGKNEFRWHPELMFNDAKMQTSYLKDLVTPVDPTNDYSFLNYLVENGQFYQFLNTDRKSITRFEFEDYCRWVSSKLNSIISYNQEVEDVEFDLDSFVIQTKNKVFKSKKLCIATGPSKNIPDCAKKVLGENVFHAKSAQMQNLNLTNKKVLIVGGGQTGVEIFRNGLQDKWGKPASIHLITGRENLQPLDEGPFTNEVFTPDFVSHFHSLDQDSKDDFTQRLILTSDGNTPAYLQELYNDLYLDKYYKKQFCSYRISPMRWLQEIDCIQEGFNATILNKLSGKYEFVAADTIILATGFKTELPSFLKKLESEIIRDKLGRATIGKNYEIQTKNLSGKLFAMNYSRHGHGVADPQTSLMSWRSAVIANQIMEEKIYNTEQNEKSFLEFFQ